MAYVIVEKLKAHHTLAPRLAFAFLLNLVNFCNRKGGYGVGRLFHWAVVDTFSSDLVLELINLL